MSKNRRRSNLPNSRLQLRLVFSFLAIGLSCLIAQFVFSYYAIRELATLFPAELDGPMEKLLTETLLYQFLFASSLMVPLMVSAGILLTFRVAGPAYRMEKYLKAISEGEQLPPCKLRNGDELQPLCDNLNAAVDYLRAQSQPTPTKTKTQKAPAHAAV